MDDGWTDLLHMTCGKPQLYPHHPHLETQKMLHKPDNNHATTWACGQWTTSSGFGGGHVGETAEQPHIGNFWPKLCPEQRVWKEVGGKGSQEHLPPGFGILFFDYFFRFFDYFWSPNPIFYYFPGSIPRANGWRGGGPRRLSRTHRSQG